MVTLTDDAIYNIILEGIGSMNGLRAELTDEEAQALVAYTRTLSVSNADAMGSIAEAPTSKALAVSGQVTNGTAGSTLTTP
ncbi:MAG UNVERIFIED_CONTAM: cytochrome c [Anaerolineae bacterium]|jgi:mono/diheme cytochrome c family protein